MDGENRRAAVDPRIRRTRTAVLAAAVDLLVEEGYEALTHPRVARAAGFAKATLYAHWPTRHDLLRDVFAEFSGIEHATPTGDLRTDLLGEVLSFRRAMVDHRIDRALTVLTEVITAEPDLVDVRERFVADGERLMREALRPHVRADDLEAVTLMLCGLVVHATLNHGRMVTDDVAEAAVDLVVAGIAARRQAGQAAASTPEPTSASTSDPSRTR